MLCAAREYVALLPSRACPLLFPTEVDKEIWRLRENLGDLLKDLSAVEDETGREFDSGYEDYKEVLGVVAKEDEICRGVEYLRSEMRSFNLELIHGHYLLKEVERVTEDLKDLLALRESGTHWDYKIRENGRPRKKTE